MIKYDYKSEGRLIRHIYFKEIFSDSDFEREIATCDELSIFYSQKLDDSINEKYGAALVYMSKGSGWNTPNYSIMIDLRKSGEDILGDFHKNRRYKVRRCFNRDNIECSIELNPESDLIEEVRAFYNEFAREKNLPPFQAERYEAAERERCLLLATAMNKDGELLVCNGYLLDNDNMVSTFAFGASHYRSDIDKSSIIGRANGALHYKVMLWLKEMGYLGFDFGGLYVGDDEGLSNISDFKRSFGGEVREYAPKIIFQKKDYECVEYNLSAMKEIVTGRKVIIWGMGNWGRYVDKRLKELYGIEAACLIDIHPQLGDRINEPDAINGYSPEDSFLIITTRRRQYDEIAKDERLIHFLESRQILCIREDKL